MDLAKHSEDAKHYVVVHYESDVSLCNQIFNFASREFNKQSVIGDLLQNTLLDNSTPA